MDMPATETHSETTSAPAESTQDTNASKNEHEPSPTAAPNVDAIKTDSAAVTSPKAPETDTSPEPPPEPTSAPSSGWGWGGATAITGWGWSTLNAAATTATTLSKKLEDIVMCPPNEEESVVTAPEKEAEAVPEVTPAPTSSFWNTDEIRFLTKIASGTVSATAKLADRGLEALGSGIETIGTGISTVTSAIPLAATSPTKPSDPTGPSDPEAEVHTTPTLQQLAAACQEQLAALASDLQSEASKLGAALVEEVQGGALSPADETQVRQLSYGETVSGLESAAVAKCSQLETVLDAAAVLEEIVAAVTAATAELVALATGHLSRVACTVDTGGDLTGLVPTWTHPTAVDTYAPSALEGVQVVMVFTVALLGRVCAAYSGLATQLTTSLKKRARAEKTKEADDLAAKARAVKGEVYVLQGRSTSALLEPLEHVLVVLRAKAMRDKAMGAEAPHHEDSATPTVPTT